MPGDAEAYFLTMVSGVVESSTGTIYVLDAAEPAVFMFAPSGRYLGRFARRGQGPGELEVPRILGLHKDSVWVWDMATARISVFSGDSAFARSLQVPVTGQGILLRSGDVAIIPPLRFRVVPEPDSKTVIWRMTGTESQHELDTLLLIARPHRTLRYAVGGNAVVGRQPLDDGPLFSASPDGDSFVYVQRGEAMAAARQFEVRVIDEHGDVVFKRRFDFEPRRITESRIRAAVDYLAQGPSSSPAGREAIRKALYVPKYLPTVSQALIGVDGTVWLRREDDDKLTARWTRIAADGVLSGDVLLPREFSPAFSRSDVLLGTSSSSEGVPRIERFEIQ